MIANALLVSLVVLGLVAAFLIGFYAYVYLRNQRLGTPGFVSRSRLTCPKCHETFDYDFVPGASVTTVRLGAGRYMACPRCGRWSYFDLRNTRIPRTGGNPPAPPT